MILQNNEQSLMKSIIGACNKIPPLWPLTNFVAVNPFLGLAEQKFSDACQTIRNVVHSDMLMPSSFYREQFDQGIISKNDLLVALSQTKKSNLINIDDLINFIEKRTSITENGIQTVADRIDQNKETQWSKLIVEEISKWCSAYYDKGQASWQMPWRSLPLYSAWKKAVAHDYSMEASGLPHFRKKIISLPDNPLEAIASACRQLSLSSEEAEDFFHRQLMSIKGWSSYVQYCVRQESMLGKQDESLLHLLAIRLCYDVTLFSIYEKEMTPHSLEKKTVSDDVTHLFLWQQAYENSFQRKFMQKLKSQKSLPHNVTARNPSLQAVFCIDVRSEVFRRALESTGDDVQTIGFAGFFGFAINYIKFGEEKGSSQCPVLLTPEFQIQETLPHQSEKKIASILHYSRLNYEIAGCWNRFKTSAISCFSFVETIGLRYALTLISDGFILKNKLSHNSCSSSKNQCCKIPVVNKKNETSPMGISLDDQIRLAEGALRNMGLTKNFAPTILICGHSSKSENNPYASSLDCGACGGHSGEANARVAALVFNEPSVREGLKQRGIIIPEETLFFSGLHNTTTDEVQLFDEEPVSTKHQKNLSDLKERLTKASNTSRKERAQAFELSSSLIESPKKLQQYFLKKSSAWSEVRPEWGLAGNAAFIAAPRARTKNLQLDGRVFLHDYESAHDEDGKILELIMSAPMVVANWINLQYYASTVNNKIFGSGNKVIHNATSGFGVFEGNGGDLQVGLPIQSLHDGKKFIHEPVRLHVFIEAPCEKINTAIAKHENVRSLVNNGWLHLFSIQDNGMSHYRYVENEQWEKTT